MGLKVGQEIKYDLISSKSALDRMHGKNMIARGSPAVGRGTIHSIEEGYVVVKGRGYLGHKLVSKSTIIE